MEELFVLGSSISVKDKFDILGLKWYAYGNSYLAELSIQLEHVEAADS